MNRYEQVKKQLRAGKKTWLITGVAGFIGSNILETLLRLDQRVIGLDDLSTGRTANLNEVESALTPRQWKNFRFVEGDIRDRKTCRAACRNADYVLHQAALGSVPLSIRDPLRCNALNVDGFLNMLVAAREARVKRLVYASTSALYGNSSQLPKSEELLGNCLSPYAASKRANELYADAISTAGATSTVGLRYFNVFGPRQDPNGPYAAVIPQWIASLITGKTVQINGDGSTTRDFCYVADVVQANLLGATLPEPGSPNSIYNVAAGRQISLNDLFIVLRDQLVPLYPRLKGEMPVHGPFRQGDVRFSQADIQKITAELGYQVLCAFENGIKEALAWYCGNSKPQSGEGDRPAPRSRRKSQGSTIARKRRPA